MTRRAAQRARARKASAQRALTLGAFRAPIAYMRDTDRIVSDVNASGAYVRNYLDSVLLTENPNSAL